ncbi:MAG: hypothetical protein JWO54_909 [Candidatus Saccharibacteria bacterium]|nr:hypothetical protein [Candidatus Saccharibacteria bacterium]
MIITHEIMDKAKTVRPFYRTVRQLFDGSYANNGFSAYIKDSQYAQGANDDIRSFLILQKEFTSILEYIEPADGNAKAYSLRLRNLLIQICTEIEANLKSILLANDYSRKGAKSTDWNMRDYCKVNQSHFLSEYVVYLPYWDGNKERQPFKNWQDEDGSLDWYQAYNATKHARGSKLMDANLQNVVDAMAALVILISAQFYTVDFIGPDFLIAETGYSNNEHAIGGYFSVQFPDLEIKDRYNLDVTYTSLSEKHIFENFPYK